MLLLFLNILLQIVFANTTGIIREIAIIILSQDNEYHEAIFRQKEKNIQQQAWLIPEVKIRTYSSRNVRQNAVGDWTIFPMLERLAHCKEAEWILFIEEVTEINLEKVLKVFEKYDPSELIFAGYALEDIEPTIIHHYAEAHSLRYPHFSAGFFMSIPLIKRLNYYYFNMTPDDEVVFSIDPKYEFAKFVWQNGKGVKLQHENNFCLIKHDENCATWIEKSFPECGDPIPSEKLQIAVKTCQKFHDDRIPVVKKTWAHETSNLLMFSDVENATIPTINVGVENVDHGHCQKTISIMKYYIDKNIPLSWLAIVDDDTIISINRLRKVLACYNDSQSVAVGERYGYTVTVVGYNYITGGGGMVFSLPALKVLVRRCKCPSINAPDDMIIGMCLKRWGIPITHLPYFHQARPDDYSPEFLKPFKHVSFHKHWMTDPVAIYRNWLQEDSTHLHTEL